jgi:hypothetical protein
MPHRIAALTVVPVVALVALAGAQTGALTPEQERGLEEARQLVREFHRVYQPLHPVDVAAASWVGARDLTQMAGVGVVYNVAAGKLYVSPGFLTAPHRDPVLAITLAHHMLRRPSQARTLADLEREQRQQRLDANAKGVEVLARARALSEPAAFAQLAGYLAGLHRAPPAGRPPALTACEQLRDLQARFPQYRDSVSTPDCPP